MITKIQRTSQRKRPRLMSNMLRSYLSVQCEGILFIFFLQELALVPSYTGSMLIFPQALVRYNTLSLSLFRFPRWIINFHITIETNWSCIEKKKRTWSTSSYIPKPSLQKYIWITKGLTSYHQPFFIYTNVSYHLWLTSLCRLRQPKPRELYLCKRKKTILKLKKLWTSNKN